jgi:Flp pilus assembly protein TadG
MIAVVSAARRLLADCAGAMAIETAFVAPVLATLALGSFEVGSIVSRQHELQTAASEGEMIVLAANSGAETSLDTVNDVIVTSLGVDDDQVNISRRFRCNDNTATTELNSCAEDDVVSSYVRIQVNETYVPVWTSFGVGGPVELSIERTVQIS